MDIRRLAFKASEAFCFVLKLKPTGVAVSHCMTWFQTQLILTTCQIRYHAIVGSSQHRTALNLDSERLSRVL